MELRTRLVPRGKVKEKYTRKGAKLPWLHPHTKPVKTSSREFTRLYHVKRSPLSIKGLPRSRQLTDSEHFRDLKHQALRGAFLKSVPISRKAFPEFTYAHKLANEAEVRESYFSGNTKTEAPLREIIDIRTPSRYSVDPLTSIHVLKSTPFYHIAKGYELQKGDDDDFLLDELGSFVRGQKLQESHTESAGDLLHLLMYRKGCREKFGRHPDVKIALSDTDDYPDDFEESVQEGVDSTIRNILSDAREQGWNPGQRVSESTYQNPLHLAFVKSMTGLNQIPRAFADILESRGKGYIRVDESFTKVNPEHRTNTNSEYGLFNQPVFEGTATPGVHYAVLDDVMTTGATLLNLGGKISSTGGAVTGFYALSNSNKQPDIVSTEPLRYLRKRETKQQLKAQLASVNNVLSSLQSIPEASSKVHELIRKHVHAKEHIERQLGTPKLGAPYERPLGRLLGMQGQDVLERILRKKIGLTYLTMTQNEIQTILKILSYINTPPAQKHHERYAPYILAAIINDPTFIPSEMNASMGSESTMKKRISEYKASHSIEDIKNLPASLI
jgi:hypothetical protein